MVRLAESITGHKVMFKEADPTGQQAPAVKPAPGDKEKNNAVAKMQEISTILSDPSVSKFQGKLGTDLGASFQKFISNLQTKVTGAIQAATGSPLEEDVTMTTDQAVKDPDTLKKLTDKNINIDLTDGDDTLHLHNNH